MLPTLRQLQYLAALKSEGSFSQAAETCHVTQSTLSAGIKELESILGLQLVERRSRRIAFTAAGERVLNDARDIMRILHQMGEYISTLSEPMTGPLRLGVIPTIAPYLLPRILSPLSVAFPKLDIRLEEGLTAQLLDRLKDGHLDVILMAFPYEASAIAHEILFEEDFVYACPAKWITSRKKISLPDIEERSLLLLEDGHCLRDQALQACRLQGTEMRRTFSAASLQTLIQMVAHGYGATLLPRMAAEEHMPDAIRLLPFENPPPTRQIGLAWVRGAARGKDFKILADTLKDIL